MKREIINAIDGTGWRHRIYADSKTNVNGTSSAAGIK
jgi:hypothetical protein